MHNIALNCMGNHLRYRVIVYIFLYQYYPGIIDILGSNTWRLVLNQMLLFTNGYIREVMISVLKGHHARKGVARVSTPTPSPIFRLWSGEYQNLHGEIEIVISWLWLRQSCRVMFSKQSGTCRPHVKSRGLLYQNWDISMIDWLIFISLEYTRSTIMSRGIYRTTQGNKHG